MFEERRNFLIKSAFKCLYQVGIKVSDKVFYQNKDIPKIIDFDPNNRKYMLLPGSGVAKSTKAKNYLQNSGILKFVFVGRLLVNKGVKEYIFAARNILEKFPNTKFDLYGFTSDDGLGEINLEQINLLTSENGVNFCGPLDNTTDNILDYDCLICPTFYNEGLPRVLLEAGSVGLSLLLLRSPVVRDYNRWI